MLGAIKRADGTGAVSMNILADIAGASGLIVLCAVTLKGLFGHRGA